MVDELPVECPNRGCTATPQRSLVNIHVREHCPSATVPCPEPKCGATVLRKDLETHRKTCGVRPIVCAACHQGVDPESAEVRSRTPNTHISLALSQEHPSECPQATVTCPDCGSEMARRRLDEHADECLEAVIACIQNANGCPWTGKRSCLSAHSEICPYEAIKGFLSIHAKGMVDLRVENVALREQVSTLKTHIQVLHQDVATAKQLLGPWYRSEVPSSVPQPVSAPSEMTVPLERATNRRRHSNPLSSGILGFSDRTSEDGDLLNSPPFSFYSQGSLLPTRGEGSSVSVLNDFTRSEPQSPIPPVNLNTTLEGSLNSLRNSIVQLSTSLDTVSRRQDMNFTTEMLRMHEEVGSLRAIVHGLRMQACPDSMYPPSGPLITLSGTCGNDGTK